MPRTNLILLALIFCLFSAPAFANDWQEKVELDFDLTYSEANPDFSPFDNGDGASIFAQVTYDSAWFLLLRHNDAAFEPSGPVSGGVVDTWFEVGLGYRLSLSKEWATEVIYTSQKVENTLGSETGYQIQIGARYHPWKPLGFALHVGQLDVLIDDVTLNFETRYQFHDHVYAITRLRDYADWDFTYYEVGLGLSF